MKNLTAILALLAASASYVVSLPHEGGNVPRGPHLQTLPLYARVPKGNKGNSGKGKGAAAAANNATDIANNGTAAAVNGTLAANGTADANNGKKNGNKGNKGQGNNNAQSLLDQLVTQLEGQLGINLGQNNQVGAGQVDVATLLKLLGARDEHSADAGLEKRQGKGKGKGGKGKGKANAAAGTGKGKGGKGKGKGKAAAAGKLYIPLHERCIC